MTLTPAQKRQAGLDELKALSQQPPAEPIAHLRDPERYARQAGTDAACKLITCLADAGMSAEQIDEVAEDVLGGRNDQPTPFTERFYAAFDRTATTCIAELRDLEAE
jgi:hypothetical protein